MHNRCGWVKPTPLQRIRALLGAHPEARDSILAGVAPAPAGDLSQYTCDLDQGQLSSCQSNGPAQALYVAMALANAQGLLATEAFVLARLWLYYGIRWLEGTVDQDAGGNIGDAFRILAAKGVPREAVYPYDVAKFRDAPGPSADMSAFDSKGKVGINYHPISSTGAALTADMEAAITSKRAVPFGCTVTEDFCSSQPSGVLHTPAPGAPVAGGHCLTVVGYDHAEQWALVKNSWSDAWGDPACPPGCFKMGYDYLVDGAWGASDAWCVDAIPGGLGQ